MKIAIVSSSKRSSGHLGGVPKYNWYLQRAIGGDILLPEEFAAKKNQYDILIADGHFAGMGLPQQKKISVAHGILHEFLVRNKGNIQDPWNRLQLETWKDPSIITVAVAPSVDKYLYKYINKHAHAVILTGIDINEFQPNEFSRSTDQLVIHAANDFNKTSFSKLDEIISLNKKLNTFKFSYLNATTGQESLKYNTGRYFLQPSNYEGNSYALLEAMACNLPIVASNVGLLEDIDASLLGKVIPWTSTAEQFLNALHEVSFNYDKYKPREYILEYATFDKFKNSWESLLKNI